MFAEIVGPEVTPTHEAWDGRTVPGRRGGNYRGGAPGGSNQPPETHARELRQGLPRSYYYQPA